MKKNVICFKRVITSIITTMAEVNKTAVLDMIKDPSCMALMPQMEEREEQLQDIMPEEELSSVSEVMAWAVEIEDLSPEQKSLLTELFDDLEVAHDHLGRACGTLGRLSQSLNGRQLLTVLKASVQSMIQINGLEIFWKEPALAQQKTELPEDKYCRVKLMMIPDPRSGTIV